LLVAPVTMRDRMQALIEREVAHKLAGRPSRLLFKMNALVDEPLIASLYRASQVGVEIDLLVRGICCLRPGVPGVSDNIRVASVVGRFLEHSRIYYFENGGSPEIYLGSADLMPRNLDRRVETLFPVKDARIRAYIRNTILEAELHNNQRARELRSDGTYIRRQPAGDELAICNQQWFLAHPGLGGRGAPFRP
jgi:polyphosphate kinase